METGTMDRTLLQDHSVEMEGSVDATNGFEPSGVRECKIVAVFFDSRSGDDVKDGGHMAVASIGHVMPSSTSTATSVAIATSGITHIVPMTWQKTKKSRSEADCSLTV
jgi:hypothetical protein